LKIKSVEFAGALASPDGPRPGSLPQVAFSGRSNVGKSSLINRVLGRTRSKVARVSSTPGKTQEINFYRVRAKPAGGGDVEFFLVDLPGYGFARVPEAVRRKWRPLIESYLSATPELRGVVQLIDARHEAKADDRSMLDYIAKLRLPAVIALTKSDKVKPALLSQQVRTITASFGLAADQVVPVSAHSGAGMDELLGALDALMADEDS
jgi:GTP-binding protein